MIFPPRRHDSVVSNENEGLGVDMGVCWEYWVVETNAYLPQNFRLTNDGYYAWQDVTNSDMNEVVALLNSLSR